MIWKEALDHQYGEPKRYESNEIAEIMDTKIVGWKRISSPDSEIMELRKAGRDASMM